MFDFIALILGKIYKATIFKLISNYFNNKYKKKFTSEELENYTNELNQKIDKLTTIHEAVDFLRETITVYKNDPCGGFIDWQTEARILYARFKKNLIQSSVDCDDNASFLTYVLKRKGFYTEVKTVSVISKKPLIAASHSFTTGKNSDGTWDVFSPYKYLGKAIDTNEIIDHIEKYYKVYNYEYYRAVI